MAAIQSPATLIRGRLGASTLLEQQMKKTSIILAITFTALLSACGKQESKTSETTAPATPEVAAPAQVVAEKHEEVEQKHDDENALGKKVFGNVCSMCHAAGAAGSPKPGDKADWGPRIAQGMDVLYKHALEGFTGAKGVMPARGGSATLTDDEVKAAVNYMVDKSK